MRVQEAVDRSVGSSIGPFLTDRLYCPFGPLHPHVSVRPCYERGEKKTKPRTYLPSRATDFLQTSIIQLPMVQIA